MPQLQTRKQLQVTQQLQATQQLQVTRTTPTFTDIEIDDLFAISGNRLVRAAKRVFLRGKIKKLEKLNLCFSDCKLLFKEKSITIDHLERYINDLKLSVGQIITFRCTYNLMPSEVKELIGLEISSNEIISLLERGFSKSNISILFKEKSFSLNNINFLLNYINIAELLQLNVSFIPFIRNIQKICSLSHESSVEALNSYELIYKSVPELLISDLVKSSNNLLKAIDATPSGVPSGVKSTISLEEILKYYMDLASGEIVKYGGYADFASSVFNIIVKIVDKLSSSKNIDIIKLFPIKPYALVVIWIAMIYKIEEKHINSMPMTMEEIVKAVLSILISILTGITGFVHSGGGGIMPINVTSYIGSFYKIQKTIEEHLPGLFKSIPNDLKVETNDFFERLSKEKQLSAGLSLSMAYTFRIGDNMIRSLVDENIFSISAAKKAFLSMRPLPQESESKRMYFLYSGYQIYTNIDMSEVFVRVPKNFV